MSHEYATLDISSIEDADRLRKLLNAARAHHEHLCREGLALTEQLTQTQAELVLQKNKAEYKTPLTKPPTFNGKSKKGFATFISQCKYYIEGTTAQFSNDAAKISFVISLLRENAYNALEPYIDQTPKPTFLQEWALFLSKLQTLLGDPDREFTFTQQLSILRQTDSVAAYSSEFFRLSSHLAWGDAPLQHHFRTGLKDSISSVLVTHDDKFESVQSLSDYCIRVENRIEQQLQAKKLRFVQPQQSRTTRITSTTQTENSSVVPMEIDATTTTRKGPITQAERERRIQNHLCMYCGDSGHVVKTCPKRSTRSASATFTIADSSVESENSSSP